MFFHITCLAVTFSHHLSRSHRPFAFTILSALRFPLRFPFRTPALLARFLEANLAELVAANALLTFSLEPPLLFPFLNPMASPSLRARLSFASPPATPRPRALCKDRA